jgi:hypothetical protein
MKHITASKSSVPEAAGPNGRKSNRVYSTPSSDVDFSIFGAREIRDILKSKAHCLKAGFPANHFIIKTLNEIRDQYIKRVGLPTYLSQMLGPAGKVPIKDCKLYTGGGRQIELHLNGNFNQPVQKFITKQFGQDKLPAVVEATIDSNSGRVEIRYL